MSAKRASRIKKAEELRRWRKANRIAARSNRHTITVWPGLNARFLRTRFEQIRAQEYDPDPPELARGGSS